MAYIHPNDPVIQAFAKQLCRNGNELRAVCGELLAWFDHNVIYSRMNAPFSPLQRSDLDVLAMRAGTCGDFSNLIVSVLTTMGFDVRYAYVHRDCYGDVQDHICAAVLDKGAYVLLDATQPYRKWHGFPCLHQEYELLDPDDFEVRIKNEEAYWTDCAQKRHNPLLAGLLYAPWLHMECVKNTDTCLDQIFYLLSWNGQRSPSLYAYYHHDTKSERTLPAMAVISRHGIRFFVSIHEPESLWDDGQWSESFEETSIPMQYLSEELQTLRSHVYVFKERVGTILRQIGAACW